MAGWHTAVKKLVHCNKDNEGILPRQEKAKWKLRRMVRVSNNYLSELIYPPCNHRIIGPDERKMTDVANGKGFAPFSSTHSSTDFSTM